MSGGRGFYPAMAIGAVLAVIAVPYVLPSYVISLLSLVWIAALLAASVNLLAGQVGLVSMGHAGIAAMAGYGVAWGTVHDLGLPVQIAVAASLTGAASVVYGLMTMRTRGIVFLMITLALGIVVFGLLFKLSSVTGGQNGLTGIRRPEVLALPWQFYYFAAGVLALALLGQRVIVRSPFGLVLRGIRESETRMSSLGYSVASAKLVAVLLSGIFAGLAGILAVWSSEFISPSAASFSRSAFAVVMVILGGTGTLLGPLAGAGIVVGAEFWLSSYVERWQTVLGLVFIAAVLFAPRGVVGQLGVMADSRRSRARALQPALPHRPAEP